MIDSRTNRKKLPSDIEAEVMFQSDRLCCIDQKRGDQIHHIDGDNSNNEFDNLALLCFDCHNEASLKGSLRKKLSSKTILKYREHHYTVIRNKREKSLETISNSIDNLSTNDLINAALTALNLFEISKIEEEYYNSAKKDRDYIIRKLSKLSGNNNARIAFEVFTFLSMVSGETRSVLPLEMAQTIFLLTKKFFPPQDSLNNPQQFFELGVQIISYAFTLVYDSLIHRKDYRIACYGLLILKFIYLESKKRKFNILATKVIQTYSELEMQFTRPDRPDLEDAKLLFKIYQSDMLKDHSLTFPRLPDDLNEKIRKQTDDNTD